MQNALLFLSKSLKAEKGTIAGLLTMVGNQQRRGALVVPPNCGPDPELWTEFCTREGFRVPEHFDMVNINSEACLLHWRVLLGLAARLPYHRKRQFRHCVPLKFQLLGQHTPVLGVRREAAVLLRASAPGSNAGVAREGDRSRHPRRAP